ncbi:MAG: hypothetical protein FJX67_08375 [Alphaproteobacteria bacterium]|nr:hypothetical protein [Alphaproteobacteria bacterium]
MATLAPARVDPLFDREAARPRTAAEEARFVAVRDRFLRAWLARASRERDPTVYARIAARLAPSAEGRGDAAVAHDLGWAAFNRGELARAAG